MHRSFLLLFLALLLAACQSSPPAPRVASITLSPTALALEPGESETLTATARDADGQALAGVSFTWASSDAAVAEVTGGRVTAKAAGTAAITASAGGVTSAPATVTVTEPAGFALEVAADKLVVFQGGSRTLDVTLTRDAGFDEAVALTLTGLPEGVSAQPVSIAAGSSAATLTLTASAAAPHSLPTAVTLTGAAGSATRTRSITVTVRGPSGSLDTSFAGGLVRTPVSDRENYATAMAVQSDGKVVVVGHATVTNGRNDMAVVRYERDGGLDESFGENGIALIPVADGDDELYAVALQTDGKIVVAGRVLPSSGGSEMGVVRLNTDGSLDQGFGTGGKVRIGFGLNADRAYAVAIQADGKIVVAGDSYQGTATGNDFALARLTTSGQLDATFGTGGKVLEAVAESSARDSAYTLLLQQVGGEERIVAAGGEGDFVLARFTAAGALDTSFGTAGRVRSVFGSTVGAAHDAELDGEGRIVVVGQSRNHFALARFDANGALDAGFGTGGTVLTPLGSNWHEAEGLAIQSDGKLVVGGWVYTGGASKGEFAVARYDATGALDAGFGDSGVTITPLPRSSPYSGGKAVALQADPRVPVTRILLAGANPDYFHNFGLARYWP